ncbi:MAG: linoleoyl-CoA desaturase [Saprospiraceae bacterium]|jgi:linoleoyl-CoA desaturase
MTKHFDFTMSQFVRFSKKDNADFVKTVKSRVNTYFNENNISKFGNYKMVLKSIFMLSLYLVPFSLIIFYHFENQWIHLALWAIMGVGMAGVGLSIMHDANHGSYSKHKWINRMMSSVIYLVGANALNWRIQHNILHHTYTNIDGLDDDIKAPVGALRFSPHQPKKKIHKYQHIYVWFFYCFLTLFWAIDADFRQIYDFKKKGLTKGHKKNFASVMFELIFFKLFYYAFIFALPLTVSSAPWWILIVGFFIMQFVAGLILTSIFQPAHVLADTEFPLPDENGKIERNWLVHQLYTTANFAQNNKFFTWFVGGLNHQVEHHLFPTICHIHYPHITKIIQDTIHEFNLPYRTFPTFGSALRNHIKALKQFGN